jgi:hypothetical protein
MVAVEVVLGVIEHQQGLLEGEHQRSLKFPFQKQHHIQ